MTETTNRDGIVFGIVHVSRELDCLLICEKYVVFNVLSLNLYTYVNVNILGVLS